MLNQQLAQGIIGISIDMLRFNADLARINAALAGLGGATGGAGVGGGVAAGVSAGVSAGFARGSAQARSSLGQSASAAVAGGVASGMAQGVAQGRAATVPLTRAVAQAVNAGMAQGVNQGVAYARGQFGGMGGGGGRAAGGGAGFGMGALQGLGLSGFAANPAMALGSMAGGGLRAGWEMVASGIKESAATAIDLQSTFLDLQRVTGGTAENTQTLKQAVFDIANKQAGVSVADVTGIMMGAAKAGVGDKEGPEGLVRFTRGIARVRNALGEGEGLNADQLTEGMTKVMNLFHLGTGSAEGLGSALVKLANISTGTGASIMNVTTGLSGTLASLGSDAATAMSFGSVVADVGLTDAQGANSLSQILRMMASDTKGMAEATGIPIVQLQQMIRTDLVGALELVVSKFRQINEVDPIKGQEFIKGLGFEGVRTAGAFQQLGSMIEQVRSRAETARGEMQTLEALTSADVLKSDQTKTGIQKMANAFEELRDAIGAHFLPGIDLATEAMTKLARAAAGNLPAILSGAGTAATDVVRAVGGPGRNDGGGPAL
jgi:TP901 family phage tail tape measure protein